MKGLFIILILLVIFTALYFINIEQKYSLIKNVELFTNINNSIFIYPNNIDNSIIDRVNIPIANFRINGLLVSKIEQIDIPNTDNMFSVYTSFTIPDNQSILSLFKTNPSDVTVSPMINIPSNELLVGKGDYICCDFPQETANYLFSKIEIVLASVNNINLFKLYTYDASGQGNNFYKIPLKTSTTATSTTLIYEPAEEKSIYCNLYLVIMNKITSLTIKSIKIYFNTPTINVSNNTSSDSVAKFLSDNEDEQLKIILPFSPGETNDTKSDSSSEKISCKTFRNIFTNLLRLKTPWAIYDGANLDNNNSSLVELGGRNCRNASIIGNYHSIETDDNIKYLKGTYNTTIIFPNGSIPRNYTICAITKYTTANINRQQILKSSSSPNLIIGHNIGGYEGIVNFKDTNYTSLPSVDPSSTKWIISCIKSSGTTMKKSILINKEAAALDNLNNYSTSSGTLTINTTNDDKTSCSNFGLSYIIIWDTILLDAELAAVSKIFDDYVNKGTLLTIPQLTINIRDGKKPETAGLSALDIKNQTCTNTNGFYWIKPEGTKEAKQIFCIMDSKCDGGGWMLALKSKEESSVFSFGSSNWTTNSEFIERLPDKDFEANGLYMDKSIDAKYDIYNTFPVRDCLAIFDPREFTYIKSNRTDNDIYTDVNNKMYGWRWLHIGFNRGVPITLLDYYKNGNKDFVYTCSNASDATNLQNFMRNNNVGGSYMQYTMFMKAIVDSGNPNNKAPLNPHIWSTQGQYLSFGFNNMTPTRTYWDKPGWAHNVRWGGSYNENPGGLPGSNDVSGGIGMEQRGYSAGDAIGCCQDNIGQNKSLSFKWFIR